MVQLNHVPVFGAKKNPVAFDVLNEQSDNITRTTWQRGRWPPRVFLFLNDFSFSPPLSSGVTTQGVQFIQYTSAF